MKRLIYLLLISALPLVVSAQSDGTNATHKNVKVNKKSKLKGSVVIGATSFESSAVLTVTSTTQGALMPRMNTTARDNISSPADGLLIFNTSTNQYEFFETTWQAVGGGGADGDGIYDGSGSLSNNPTIVTQDANKLQFTSSIVDGFSVDGTTFSVDASNNRIGFGTNVPAVDVELNRSVNADLEFRIRNTNAGASATANIALINDATAFGNIYIASSGFSITTLRNQFNIQGESNTTGMNFTINRTAGGDFRWFQNEGGSSYDAAHTDMILNSIGNLGIGTSAVTSARLHVAGINAASTSDAFLVEDNVGTDLFIIENAGDVGIGLSDPLTKFHVRKTSGSAIFATFESTSGDAAISIKSPNANVAELIFSDASANRGDIFMGTTDNMVFRTNVFTETPLELKPNGDVVLNQTGGKTTSDGQFSVLKRDINLGVAATTFVTTSNVLTIVGDGGGNTIATITGASSGMLLTLIFVDANVTITNDSSHGANSVDLSAAFTSADDTTLQIVFDGTSWYEISRSTN